MGETEEKKEKEIVVEASEVKEEHVPDFHSVEVKNPKSEKVLRLEKEIRSRHGQEVLRNKRLQVEQDYVAQMLESVEKSLKSEQEIERQNDLFENRIKSDVYRMHGLSEDKLQGMSERKIAWIQGSAFALFFLSCVMVLLCGAVHGFDDPLTLFAAFYTAIEGTLLTNGKRKARLVSGFTGILYLLLFPIILVMFVTRELGYDQYEFLISVFAIVGLAILVAGSVSYFLYNPYQEERYALKQANRYIKKMEKAASSDVKMREKEIERQKKQQEKEAEKEKKRLEKEAEKEKKRQEKEAEKERKRLEKEEKKEASKENTGTAQEKMEIPPEEENKLDEMQETEPETENTEEVLDADYVQVSDEEGEKKDETEL
jgi:hypothetical protein